MTIADLRVVAALVAVGSVLDLADGPVARRFGSSGMGEGLDAICDTVTFGLAPAAVVAASGSVEGGLRYVGLIAAGGAYLVAMILRLVRSWLTSSEPASPRGSKACRRHPLAARSSRRLAWARRRSSPACSSC